MSGGRSGTWRRADGWLLRQGGEERLADRVTDPAGPVALFPVVSSTKDDAARPEASCRPAAVSDSSRERSKGRGHRSRAEVEDRVQVAADEQLVGERAERP